jgi:toxin-antitoxin system PIN domain toxin
LTTELPDVNVLVAAHIPSHAHHRVALNWLTNAPRYATTAVTESGFVRVMFNPLAAGQQLGIAFVLGALAKLRADNHADFWPDDTSFDKPHINLMMLTGHRQITDFHLVNLAAARGGVLVTLDQRLPPSLAQGDRHHVKVLTP